MTENHIKKAADLLLKGAKMLNIACPACGNPIYYLKNQSMYCVACDQKIIHEADKNEKKPHTDQSLHDLINPIQIKIEQLGKLLLEEDNKEKIIEIAKLIKKLTKLL